jgi:hypothetical protein
VLFGSSSVHAAGCRTLLIKGCLEECVSVVCRVCGWRLAETKKTDLTAAPVKGGMGAYAWTCFLDRVTYAI